MKGANFVFPKKTHSISYKILQMRVLYTNPCRDVIVPSYVDATDSRKGEEDHCWMKAMMRIVLGHNRVQPLVWKIKRKYRKFRLHLHKDRRHWMFTWKPKLGKKTTGCVPLCERKKYKVSLKGNDLELYVFANRRLQQKDVLYLTLSHSLYIHTQYTR